VVPAGIVLFMVAVVWVSFVLAGMTVRKTGPTRSLLEEMTRPSADQEREDLERAGEASNRFFRMVLRLWPLALASLVASVILLVVGAG
jgi:hypothetical protein